MRRIRVYVDTSVFGGVADEEFAVSSRRFFDRVQRAEFVVLISQITIDELAEAPQEAQQILKDLPDDSLDEVAADDWRKRIWTLAY